MSVPHLPALLLLVACAACSPDGSPRRGPVGGADPVKPTEALRAPERDRVQLTGTIHRFEGQGGGFVIRTVDGEQYLLVELPERFRQEGLAVRVDGLRHDDVLARGMAGQAVDIVEITEQ